MIAVVDAAAEFGIEIRAAAPAGMAAGLVQHNRAAGGGQLDRRGEPRQTGADDMHPAHLPDRHYCRPGAGRDPSLPPTRPRLSDLPAEQRGRSGVWRTMGPGLRRDDTRVGWVGLIPARAAAPATVSEVSTVRPARPGRANRRAAAPRG